MEKRKRELKERLSETEDCFRLCREREREKERKKKEKRKKKERVF
jgi:hypothetical protein